MTNDELRAVLTEALSEVLKRLWPAPEDAADQADWDALPGKLADVIVSLPARQVRQWLLTLLNGPLREAMAAQDAGPHTVTAKDGRAALCGGPGACYVCDKEA